MKKSFKKTKKKIFKTKHNIKKEKYVEDIIDYDHFEEFSLAIKSAFNHVMQYCFPPNFQEEEQANEIIGEENIFVSEEYC